MLNSIDGSEEYNNILVSVDTHIMSEYSIALDIVSLPFRRLWNVDVFAHNCENHALTENIEIGTRLISVLPSMPT